MNLAVLYLPATPIRPITKKRFLRILPIIQHPMSLELRHRIPEKITMERERQMKLIRHKLSGIITKVRQEITRVLGAFPPCLQRRVFPVIGNHTIQRSTMIHRDVFHWVHDEKVVIEKVEILYPKFRSCFQVRPRIPMLRAVLRYWHPFHIVNPRWAIPDNPHTPMGNVFQGPETVA
jgi:hypothetical protein